MTILQIINEEIQNVALDKRIKCIADTLEAELNSYGNSENWDDRWFEIKQVHRKFTSYLKYGAFSVNNDDNDVWLNNFVQGLNSSENNTYRKGDDVTNEFPDLGRDQIYSTQNIRVFRASGDKTLFRGVSVDDWNRIKSQGYIDSDMRGAIISTEGINLAQTPSTAQYYLPHSDQGVILAVNPQGLDLYMLTDEYIRVFEPIPVGNIIKVSDVVTKTDMGGMLSTNNGELLKRYENELNKLNVPINCN